MADDVDMAALDAAGPRQGFDPVRLLLDGLAAIGTIWDLRPDAADLRRRDRPPPSSARRSPASPR
jgi:hypothetical protein